MSYEKTAGTKANVVVPIPVSTNCTGKLIELPAVEGATSHRYQCIRCHQIVVVGHEQLAESGVPTEHSPDLL